MRKGTFSPEWKETFILRTDREVRRAVPPPDIRRIASGPARPGPWRTSVCRPEAPLPPPPPPARRTRSPMAAAGRGGACRPAVRVCEVVAGALAGAGSQELPGALLFEVWNRPRPAPAAHARAHTSPLGERGRGRRREGERERERGGEGESEREREQEGE